MRRKKLQEGTASMNSISSVLDLDVSLNQAAYKNFGKLGELIWIL